MKILKTYCRFCLAHCSLIATIKDPAEEIVFRGDQDDPVTRGYVCSKGRSLGLFNRTNRLLMPLARSSGATDWIRVIADFSKTIENSIKKGGSNAFGIYTGTHAMLDAAGQWAAIGLMIRLKSSSIYSPATIDNACRPFVAEHMCGMPSLFPQLHDEAKVWILVGTNPVVSHGHIAGCPNPVGRIRQFKNRGGILVVVDPRKTQTSGLADLHIRSKPGSDHFLLGYVVKEILLRGSDNAFLETSASGLNALRAAVSAYDREDIENRVETPLRQVDALLKIIRENRRCAVICGTGVSFSLEAVRTEFFAWALMAVTGSLDSRQGAWFNPGWFGSNAGLRYQRANGSGAGPKSRPELKSRMGEMPCAALADEIEAGNLKTMMVLGGNPLTAIANGKRLQAAFENLDGLGIVDIKNNPLIQCATHVFPAASQLERSDATVYVDKNMSGVYARYTPPVALLPGLAKPMWWIIQKIGEELGVDAVGLGIKADKLTDDEVLRSISRNAPESFDRLMSTGFQMAQPVQPVGWITRWIKDNAFKWNLNPPCKEHTLHDEAEHVPMRLISGRQRCHVNATFVDEPLLNGKSDELRVTISPRDAEEKSLKNDDIVRIVNPYGNTRCKVRVSDNVLPGVVHIPHGWGSFLTSEYAGVDPETGMIRQTGLPVETIEKIHQTTVTESGL